MYSTATMDDVKKAGFTNLKDYLNSKKNKQQLPRKQKETTNIVFIPKRTTIGRGKIGFSTMNKHKRRSYKKYRGQGK